MLALLPVMLSALQMQMTDIERSLNKDVREKLADGWSLVDVRGDYEELTLTLTKGTKIEQHVAHIEGKHSAYRIDVVNAVPKELRAPDALMLLALSGGGGIEITNPCGRLEARAYIVEGSAKGAAAARFVSKTIKSSVDLEAAYVEDGLATFHLELRDGAPVELRVTLDEDIVVAAEARRYEYGSDNSRHTRQSKLRRAVGNAVTSIEDGINGPILVGAKRFEIDLGALELHDPEDHGCGC